jgi:hypothetical protein
MRCQCCNANLSDYESVLKHPVTMEYLDICNKCLRDIPIDPIEPDNIVDTVGYDDEEFTVDRETEEQWGYLNDGRE